MSTYDVFVCWVTLICSPEHESEAWCMIGKLSVAEMEPRPSSLFNLRQDLTWNYPGFVWTHHLAHTGLELVILQPQPPQEFEMYSPALPGPTEINIILSTCEEHSIRKCWIMSRKIIHVTSFTFHVSLDFWASLRTAYLLPTWKNQCEVYVGVCF